MLVPKDVGTGRGLRLLVIIRASSWVVVDYCSGAAKW
jgi:hypothetical protein